jgi:hypothetical protein
MLVINILSGQVGICLFVCFFFNEFMYEVIINNHFFTIKMNLVSTVINE